MLSNMQILKACKYIDRMDKNSDIMNFYIDYTVHEVSYDTIYECLETTFTEWAEDMIINGITEEEKFLLAIFEINVGEVIEVIQCENYLRLEEDYSLLLSEYNQVNEKYIKVLDELNHLKSSLKNIIKDGNL